MIDLKQLVDPCGKVLAGIRHLILNTSSNSVSKQEVTAMW